MIATKVLALGWDEKFFGEINVPDQYLHLPNNTYSIIIFPDSLAVMSRISRWDYISPPLQPESVKYATIWLKLKTPTQTSMISRKYL